MSATQNITFTNNDWYNKIAIVDTARVMVKSDENVPIGKFIAARFKVGTSQGSLNCLLSPDKIYDLVSDSTVPGLMGNMRPKLSGFKLINSSDQLEQAFNRIDSKYYNEDGSLSKAAEIYLKGKLKESIKFSGSPRELGHTVAKIPYDHYVSQDIRNDNSNALIDPKKEYVKFKGPDSNKEYWCLAFDHDPYYIPMWGGGLLSEVLWFARNKTTGEVEEYQIVTKSFAMELRENRLKLATALKIACDKYIELLRYEGESGRDFGPMKERIEQEAKNVIGPLACKQWATSGSNSDDSLVDIDVDAYLNQQYEEAKLLAQLIIVNANKYLGPSKPSMPRYLGELVMVQKPNVEGFRLESPQAWFEMQCILLSIFASSYDIHRRTGEEGSWFDQGDTNVERVNKYGVYQLLDSSASFVEHTRDDERFSYTVPGTRSHWQGSNSIVKYKANSGEKYSMKHKDKGLPDVMEELYDTLGSNGVTMLALANTFRNKPEYINSKGGMTDDTVGWVINPKLIDVAEFIDDFKLYDYTSTEGNSENLGAIYHKYARLFTVKTSNWLARKMTAMATRSIGSFDSFEEAERALKDISEGIPVGSERITKKEMDDLWKAELEKKGMFKGVRG